MSARIFTLGAVLSITDGHLFTSMEQAYAILNHMTGDNLFTHQLPRAMRECAPHLLRQFPQLRGIHFPHDKPLPNWKEILDALIIEHGDEFAVNVLPPHAHEFIDPVSELAEKIHPDKTIVVGMQ